MSSDASLVLPGVQLQLQLHTWRCCSGKYVDFPSAQLSNWARTFKMFSILSALFSCLIHFPLFFSRSLLTFTSHLRLIPSLSLHRKRLPRKMWAFRRNSSFVSWNWKDVFCLFAFLLVSMANFQIFFVRRSHHLSPLCFAYHFPTISFKFNRYFQAIIWAIAVFFLYVS